MEREVSNSVKLSETMSFVIHIPKECWIKQITLTEASSVIKTIKNNKYAGSDGIVGELITYGGKPMCEMFLTLFNLVWNNKYIHVHVPSYCREGLIVSLFKKGGGKDPGNYIYITLLNLIGKLYSRVINNHLLKYLELK